MIIPQMLIDGLHHPFLHNAARVRTVNIDIDTRCLILEPYARARRSPFSVYFITEMRQQAQRLLVCEVLWLFLESFN